MDDERRFRWRFPKDFGDYYITTQTNLAFNQTDAIDEFDEPGIRDEWHVRSWLWELVRGVFHRSRLCDILSDEVQVGADFGYSDREIVDTMSSMITRGQMLLYRAEPMVGQVAAAPLYSSEEAEADASAAAVRAKTFIEIEIVDADNRPVPNQSFDLELADGRKVWPKTNRDGVLRIEPVPEGMCEFTLSDYDADAWGPAK